MAVYKTKVKIRFAHCDPAGILFYPRYFEILNGVVEDWFDEEIGYSFNQLLTNLGLGTPMVDVHTEFLKPCRLDDILAITLCVKKLGRASVVINVNAKMGTDIYIRTRAVLVCSKNDLSSSVPWPDDIAQNIHKFLI